MRFSTFIFCRQTFALLLCAGLALAYLSGPGRAIAAEDAPAASKVRKQVDEERQAIYDLQQELIPLLRNRTDDAENKAKIAELEKKIAAHGARIAQLLENYSDTQVALGESQNLQHLSAVYEKLAALETELALQNHQVDELSRQFESARQQFVEAQRAAESLPLEGAEIKVFLLRRARAVEAANTVGILLGSDRVRVAVDERTNSLIVAGNAEALSVVEALLLRLDEQAAKDSDDKAAGRKMEKAGKGHTLLLRVFWLADGLPEDEGEAYPNYMPEGLWKASQQLGLQGGKLVAQTVTSLALSDADKADFSMAAPVRLFGRTQRLSCSGQLRDFESGRAHLDANLTVVGPSAACELNGSLVLPLGHYMILGAANSVSDSPETVEQHMLEKKRPTVQNASHFAFVFQVIEAESYAPKTKDPADPFGEPQPLGAAK